MTPEPAILAKIKNLYQSKAFLTHLPSTPEGDLDVGPFQEIEAMIKGALSARITQAGEQVALTETIMGESVVRVMSAQNNSHWEGDSRAMLRDAWPLLLLDLHDPDYAHLLAQESGFPKPVEYSWFVNDAQAHPASNKSLRNQLTADYANNNAIGQAPLHDLTTEIEPSLAALVYLRGSFPSRIIQGLNQADRRALLGDSGSLYYARADVLPPAAPGEIESSAARLLLLEVLRIANCLPAGLTAAVDETMRYNITYQGPLGNGATEIETTRWKTAIHKFAVAGDLPDKVDGAYKGHFESSTSRGEAVAALTKLRAEQQKRLRGAAADTSGICWEIEPGETLTILDRIDAKYGLTLPEAQVRQARKLLLTLLTLRHDPELTNRLPYQTTGTDHIFTYTDRRAGLEFRRQITLNKLDSNVASRTLAADGVARDDIQGVWNDLLKLPGRLRRHRQFAGDDDRNGESPSAQQVLPGNGYYGTGQRERRSPTLRNRAAYHPPAHSPVGRCGNRSVRHDALREVGM